MLSNARDDDGPAVREFRELLNDVLRQQFVGVALVHQGMIAFEVLDMLNPVNPCCRLHALVQDFQNRFQIADYRHIHRNVFANLRWIDVNVNLLGVHCEF